MKGELRGSPSSQAGSPSRWWAHTWRDPHHSPMPCSAWAPAVQQHQTPQHHAPDPSLQHPEPSGISKPPARGDAGPGSPRLLLSPGTNPPSPAPKLLQISRRAVSTTAILPNPFSLGRRLFCSNCQRLREVLGAESILTPSPQRVRGKWSKNQLLKRRDTEAERRGDLQAGGSGLGERREG